MKERYFSFIGHVECESIPKPERIGVLLHEVSGSDWDISLHEMPYPNQNVLIWERYVNEEYFYLAERKGFKFDPATPVAEFEQDLRSALVL